MSNQRQKLEIEAGQTLVDFEQLTDIGNHQTFLPSAAIMSSVAGIDVVPDGVTQGINILSPSSTNNAVAVATFAAASGGVEHQVTADPAFVLTRPGTDVAKIVSICMDAAGALEEVEGTPAANTTFVTTRGVAGGPPLIPVGSVEIGQVWFTTSAAAPITANEIRQNGAYTERSMFPIPAVDPIGRGVHTKDGAGTANAHVMFNEPLPAIHTGGVPKEVWAKYGIPSFAHIPLASDFNPAEISHSITSTETYDGPRGSRSSSLGNATFTALLEDGVNDLLVANKDQDITFRFYPNRNRSAHIITQGTLGMQRSYPAAGDTTSSCTITPRVASAEFAG